MTKIKLTNGTIIDASDIKFINGALKITTTDFTVEKLAQLFSKKENTSLITLMTESDVECGFKTGFTSFAGISYDANGVKTVELFQPVDATEARIAKAEGKANEAINTANAANNTASAASAKATATNEKALLLEEQNAVLASTVDSILTDVIPSLVP